MNIMIDAMGGDNAPVAPLLGAAAAVRAYGVTVTAVGRKDAIGAAAKEHNISMQGIAVQHAETAVAGHRDRHARLGHRVHGRGDERRIDPDATGEARARVGLTRDDVGVAGKQHHVVVRESNEAKGVGLVHTQS